MRTQDFFKPTNARSLIALRFHDLSKKNTLLTGLACACAQEGVEAEALVVTQNFESGDLEELRRFIGHGLPFFSNKIHVLNSVSEHRIDMRTKLLNEAIEFALDNSFEYLSFLDYDDILFPFAHKVLINSCKMTEARFAYADIYYEEIYSNDLGDSYTVSLRDVYEISKKTKKDLLQGNFLPLHSYIFHTNIFRDGLRYDEEFSRVEDYELLIRLAENEVFSNLVSHIVIGSYRQYCGKHIINTTDSQYIGGNNVWRENHKKLLIKHKAMNLNLTLFEAQMRELLTE